MAQITRHEFIPARGIEVVNLIDCHGRPHEIQVSVLDHPNPQAFIAEEIKKFEAQEDQLSEHLQRWSAKPNGDV